MTNIRCYPDQTDGITEFEPDIHAAYDSAYKWDFSFKYTGPLMVHVAS